MIPTPSQRSAVWMFPVNAPIPVFCPNLQSQVVSAPFPRHSTAGSDSDVVLMSPLALSLATGPSALQRPGYSEISRRAVRGSEANLLTSFFGPDALLGMAPIVLDHPFPGRSHSFFSTARFTRPLALLLLSCFPILYVPTFIFLPAVVHALVLLSVSSPGVVPDSSSTRPSAPLLRILLRIVLLP